MAQRILLLLLPLAAGCSFYARTNVELEGPLTVPPRATFDLAVPRGRPDVLVVLALSGGGSRAAYFGASVMLRLQTVLEEIDILEEVDAISAVSGGCLPAAYYCVSKDREAPDGEGADRKQGIVGRIAERSIDTLFARRYWDPEEVGKLMSRNYTCRWIGNWFWPHNIVRYWCTAFDRSDIMARTLADNLFDRGLLRWDFRLGELNPDRPYLIINATDGTESVEGEDHFGTVFTFTAEDFKDKLNSDINRYSVARAVMASASFPGVFNYMTLEDYRDLPGVKRPRYLHVFDGGNSDNLGLTSVKRLIFSESGKRDYAHFVVVLVDAHVRSKGVDRNRYDARSFLSYIIDFNLMDTMDALLDTNRENLLSEFWAETLTSEDGNRVIENLTFWQIQFDDVPEDIPDPYDENDTLLQRLHDIPTNLSISTKNCRRVGMAVDAIVTPDHPALRRVKEALLSAAAEDR